MSSYIHPRFIHTGTSSSRLASSKPNFQNVPARGFGAQVRKAIVARPGHKLVKADKCVAPETKLLKSDLTWVCASEVKEGDELIGFDEVLHGHENKFRRSIVTGTKRVKKPTTEIITSSGKRLCVSSDHQWVIVRCRKSGGGYVRQWIETNQMCIGERLPVVTDVWENDSSWEAGFISGFAAGEGWLYNGTVGVGQNEGRLLDYVLDILHRKGFDDFYHDAQTYRKPVYHRYNIKNVRGGVLRFLGVFQPPRLMDHQQDAWEGRRTWGKLTEYDTVVSLEEKGEQEHCAIETTTHTFIAEGYLSHNCQLELRICLWLSGVDVSKIDSDAFRWLVNKAGGSFEEAAERYHGTARDIAKSVSHGGDYLEGVDILHPSDLTRSKLQEIEYGSLRVYGRKYMDGLKRDWEYGGGLVCFTGANLADRLFGDHSQQNRKRALEIQEDIYFRNFPSLRRWQQTVLEEVEKRRGVRLETGAFIELPDITADSPRENAKIACALKGQGNGAEHIVSCMLAYRRLGIIPLAQVHDELIFEVPLDWGEDSIRELLRPMMVEDWRMKGFICPIKAKVGPNWLEMTEISL